MPPASIKSTLRQSLPERYLTALRTHLRSGTPGKSPGAQALGRTALADGLTTLALARMHEESVVILASSFNFAEADNNLLKRAGHFFTEALIPLEVNQRAIRETNEHWRQRIGTLRLHTAALLKGNQHLEREVARRKKGEAVILKGKEQYRLLFIESQAMQKHLRQLARKTLSAQEEERKQISRELHDEVVQTLVGINVQLAALGKGASVGLYDLKAAIACTQRLVETSVKEVHRFARELRPAALDDLGLIPALHAYSKNLATRKKIKIQLTAFAGVEALPAAKRTVLYRVAQEALNNVVRHAQATLIKVTISKTPRGICMEINDNGKSFVVKKVFLIPNPKRLGLIGMKERIEMIGGNLTIKSAPGQGTTVRAEIPFKLEKTKK